MLIQCNLQETKKQAAKGKAENSNKFSSQIIELASLILYLHKRRNRFTSYDTHLSELDHF